MRDGGNNRLHTCCQAIDLDRLLDHVVTAHNEAIARKDLVVGGDIPLFPDGFQVNLVDSGRFPVTAGAYEADVFGFSGWQQSTPETRARPSRFHGP